MSGPYLAHEVLEVLIVSERLFGSPRVAHKELDGHRAGLTRLQADKADGDLDSEGVFASLELVDEQSGHEALAVEHLHLEKGIVAILAATGVEIVLVHRNATKS